MENSLSSTLTSFLNFYLCHLLIFEVLHWKQNHLAFDDYFHNLEFDHLGHLSLVDMKGCTPVARQRTKHKRSSIHHPEVRQVFCMICKASYNSKRHSPLVNESFQTLQQACPYPVNKPSANFNSIIELKNIITNYGYLLNITHN